jgi:predicted dehydrogenase
MDLAKQSTAFKVRKVLRYARIYGLSRTMVKVRAQRHMATTYAVLPAPNFRPGTRRHVGIIGCGKFAFSTIAYYLNKKAGPVIRAAMDVDLSRAASLFERYDLEYYTDDAERLLQDPQIDLVYVASNHASHAEYAIRALQAGKCVHIEKPHVVSEDQLIRLCNAMTESPGGVMLGFNRPFSRIGREIKTALDGQEGPALYSWFVVGHELPEGHWYLQKGEGGRVLGNLCHWTDFVLELVPAENRYPIQIRPTRAGRPDVDVAVSFIFGDGSIASISFAEAESFEGVRETFAAHRGDVIIAMSDFKTAKIQRIERTTVIAPRFRDHGHEATILRSYGMVRPTESMARIDAPRGRTVRYVWDTAQLFLKTQWALDEDQIVLVEPFGEPGL